MDSNGYLRISAGKHRNKFVHTLVAEAMLGRELEKDEDVHHKDGNKLNPEWTNLQVIGHLEHGYVSSAQAQFMKRKEQHEKEQWESYDDR